MFSGSYDKSVRVWDVHSLQCLSTLQGHSGAVRALAASSKRVFSGSDDTTIKVGLLDDAHGGMSSRSCRTACVGNPLSMTLECCCSWPAGVGLRKLAVPQDTGGA